MKKKDIRNKKVGKDSEDCYKDGTRAKRPTIRREAEGNGGGNFASKKREEI